MEMSVAVDILNSVRTFYASGKKSFNKIYELNEEQKKNPKMVEKAERRFNDRIASQKLFEVARGNPRLLYDTPAGNCHPMAMRAAALAIWAGGKAMLVKVEHPADHAFCIVDYPSHAGTPGNVNEMAGYQFETTWVIDPWMNICCQLHKYPKEAEDKLQKWSKEGKHIMFGKGFKPHDPIHSEYKNAFFIQGPLCFEEVFLM